MALKGALKLDRALGQTNLHYGLAADPSLTPHQKNFFNVKIICLWAQGVGPVKKKGGGGKGGTNSVSTLLSPGVNE